MTERIAYVADYWDEERTVPAHYIVERNDGQFEARVPRVLDREIKERVLGTFTTCDEARHAMRDYERRCELADPSLGFEDFIIHRLH